MMKKTILITGASRGIGAATALLAAKKGYRVCVNYLSNETAARALAQKLSAEGGDFFLFQADVSSEPQVTALFEEIDRRFGKLDVLVNNAGILETQTRVDQMDAARLQRIFTSNITGYFLCSKEAVKRMSTKYGGQGGAIVNVSSIAAKTGSPNEYVDYAAAKAAIDALTIGLSKEVAEEGIRVNAVRPGFIYTDIHASGGEPGRVDRLAPLVPMKRGGYPEEVAQGILWLASEEASFSTGAFLDIAGGR